MAKTAITLTKVTCADGTTDYKVGRQETHRILIRTGPI